MSNPSVHQQSQAFPRLNSPFLNEDLTLAQPWYRLLITLWQRGGNARLPGNRAAYLSQSGVNGGPPILVYDALTNVLLGELSLGNKAGGAPQPQVLAGSPFIFVAGKDGFLDVFAGAVDISRDAGVTWYQLSLQGGAFPVKLSDRVRVTWYGAAAPIVTFFPNS